MLTRKQELIDKLDSMDDRQGVGEMVSDLVISTTVNAFDALLERKKDSLPPSMIRALNNVIDGFLDGEFEKDK